MGHSVFMRQPCSIDGVEMEHGGPHHGERHSKARPGRDHDWLASQDPKERVSGSDPDIPVKAQAPMWARQIENEMDRGAFVPHAEFESTTREEALDRYAREILPQKKRASFQNWRGWCI